MVAIPTNYKMGTGLAATIMGQQAGLEAEQQGLSNLFQAMKMPQQALQGQEAAMLMQDPNYLQQKTANTLIELKNQYSAQDFQQTLCVGQRRDVPTQLVLGERHSSFCHECRISERQAELLSGSQQIQRPDTRGTRKNKPQERRATGCQ